MELYHNVLNIERLKSILNSGYVFVDEGILTPCVYLTRNKNYLNSRGIKMVFDYKKLRNNYKVKPFSYKGWLKINKPNHKFISKTDEMEERCYNNIDVERTCLRIEVNSKIHKNIDIKHHLIKIMEK